PVPRGCGKESAGVCGCFCGAIGARATEKDETRPEDCSLGSCTDSVFYLFRSSGLNPNRWGLGLAGRQMIEKCDCEQQPKKHLHRPHLTEVAMVLVAKPGASGDSENLPAASTRRDC